MSESKIPQIIARLYLLVDELESLFPERRFTPDGHLVGSIGEVVAKYFYALELLPPSCRNLDAHTREDPSRTVQIKLTAGNVVSFADYDDHPDLLIVMKIDRCGGFDEVYNGPYPHDLLASKSVSKRRVRSVSTTQLRNAQSRIQRALDDEGRIRLLNESFIKVVA
ncbi:MAG: hypothetical protein ABSF75_14765 [Terracidiphilus sp.]|jgi:hypothetical protein